jgi:hypothetical protein
MNIKKNIFLILSVVFIFSCSQMEQVVDIAPTTLLTEETAITSPSDAQQLLLSVYGGFRGNYIEYISIADYCSDDVQIDPTGGQNGSNMYEYIFDPVTSSTSAVWNSSYRSLHITNVVIKRLNEMQVTGSALTLKNNLLGEAYALRALIHFDLLRYFGNGTLGVPYVELPSTAASRYSRSTVAECYTKILADIAVAESFLTMPAFPMPDASTVRVTEAAVVALKARVFLQRGEWANAISAVNQILPAPADPTFTVGTPPASSLLSPRANFSTIYRPPFTNNPQGEVLFKIKYLSASEGTMGNKYWGENTDIVYFRSTADLRNSYVGANDVRFGVYFGLSTNAPQRDIPIKYRGGAGAAQGVSDVPIFRTAELYLIRAECNARLGNLVLAQHDYNTLRRARITGYTNADFSASTQAAVINNILAERRRELAFEGHRFLDARRLGLPIVRVNCTAGDPNACNIQTNSPLYYKVQYFPIPFQETLTNPNMVQNPGY